MQVNILCYECSIALTLEDKLKSGNKPIIGEDFIVHNMAVNVATVKKCG